MMGLDQVVLVIQQFRIGEILENNCAMIFHRQHQFWGSRAESHEFQICYFSGTPVGSE